MCHHLNVPGRYRRSSAARRVTVSRVAVGLIAVAVAGCGSSHAGLGSARSGTSTTAYVIHGRWIETGLGTPLIAWESRHPRASGRVASEACRSSKRNCYGSPIVVGGVRVYPFSAVMTAGSPRLVAGYTQAFSDGTTVDAAKAAVHMLLPRDTRGTTLRASLSRTHRCMVWDLSSRTLASRIGAPARGLIRVVFESRGRRAAQSGFVNRARVRLTGVTTARSC